MRWLVLALIDLELAADPAARYPQLQLLGALDASSRALRRYECGDWRINGKHGGIYADGDGAGHSPSPSMGRGPQRARHSQTERGPTRCSGAPQSVG
jgi:hypothetical protein